MSGGSFNYLFQAELTQMLWAVEAMRDRLKELGQPKAAARTEEVARRMREIDEIQAELAAVWRAVEWHDSGDTPADYVTEAASEWKAHRNDHEDR